MSILDAFSGIANAALPLPWLVTGGQPSADQFKAAHAAGVKVVIDSRDPMEPRPFNEPTLLKELGMEYIVIPVGPGTLTDATHEKLLAALRTHAGTPTIYHCASGNRVAGSLIPYLMLDEKMTEEEAIEAAMRIGLRSAELLSWGTEYARGKQG